MQSGEPEVKAFIFLYSCSLQPPRAFQQRRKLKLVAHREAAAGSSHRKWPPEVAAGSSHGENARMELRCPEMVL